MSFAGTIRRSFTSSSPSSMTSTATKAAKNGVAVLDAVCRANRGLIRQSLNLMESLIRKHGTDRAMKLYKTPCKIVGASIGQHVRHSSDHIERAAAAAAAAAASDEAGDTIRIRYDLRERGGTDEHDMSAARERLLRIDSTLEGLASSSPSSSSSSVSACFMLSGDSDDEYDLRSTCERELGFAAHHAIHHLALVKIIAVHTAGLGADNDLPSDFGRAPSTVNYETTTTSSS